MWFPIIITILSIFVTIFFGVISNWVYSILRNKGVFPDNPSRLAVSRVILASLSVIAVMIMMQLLSDENQSSTAILLIPVPLWLTTILIIVAFVMTRVAGNKLSPTGKNQHDTAKGSPIWQIDFDYKGSLIENGWNLHDNPSKVQPIIEYIDDGFRGKVVKITATTIYALDYEVSRTAKAGRLVEFVVKYENTNSRVCALVKLRSQDNSNSRLGWLDFPISIGPPSPYGDGEWVLPITPIVLDGNWLLLSVNLDEAVQRTFGKSGWKYESLERFRVRGNLLLARISVFELR